MADWCSLEFRIDCASGRDALAIDRLLKRAVKTAERDGDDGICIGAERFVFSHEWEVFGTVILLRGEVRWAFEHDDMLRFIDLLTGNADIRAVSCDYDSPGCLVFGHYHYDGRTLIDRYLPEDQWPEYNQLSDYDLALKDALADFGKDAVVWRYKKVA